MLKYTKTGERAHSRERSDMEQPALAMKPPAEVEFLEEARLLIWRPRDILDEAAVNKILVDLVRREAMAPNPFNRFCDLSAVESFTLPFPYFFPSSLHPPLPHT